MPVDLPRCSRHSRPSGPGFASSNPLVCFLQTITEEGARPFLKGGLRCVLSLFSIVGVAMSPPLAHFHILRPATPHRTCLLVVPMSNVNLTLARGYRVQLDLTDLKYGSPGITPAFGQSLAEAAGVCLEDRQHSSPTSMPVSGDAGGEAILTWMPTSPQVRRCWNDDEVATEHGAYGIAVLLVPRISDLQVVERSKKGTGFDYWLGTSTEPDSLFQNKARLEVSGIRSGADTVIARRVRKKIRQTQQSPSTLAALVVVVEFGGPQSRIATR